MPNMSDGSKILVDFMILFFSLLIFAFSYDKYNTSSRIKHEKERSFCRFDKDFRIAGRQEIKKYVSLSEKEQCSLTKQL